MFVTTQDGLIPMSQIRRVRHSRANDAQMLITYGEGDSTIASVIAWDEAVKDAVVSTFPAQPGTYSLWFGLDGGEFWVGRSNVIAWAISLDGILYPVTADGVNGGNSENNPILHPDGRIDIPLDRSFDSFDEWKAHAEGKLRKETS